MEIAIENCNLQLSPPETPPAEPSQTRYRWIILALVWLLYVSHGIISRSASPLVTPMLKDLDMSYGQMGFVLGSWQLTYIVVALVAGIVLDQWGLRNSLFFGTVFISLSAALRFFAQGFASLLPMVALFGVGGPLISIGAPKTISLWFKGKDRGTAVGIYTTGPWIGQMLVLAVTNGLIMPFTGYSWRLTFVYYGLFTFGTALLWWFFAKDPDTEKSSEGFHTVRVIGRLIKVYNIRIILSAGLFSFAISHGFVGWLPKLLENSGISPVMAGILSALPFLAGIGAVLMIPRLVPPRFRALVIALVAILSGVAIMLVAVSVLPLLLSLILYGIAAPSLMPLLVLMLMETPEVGSEYMGSAGGMFFCIAEIGGFFGPFVVGALVDLTGSFLAGAVFLAMLGVAIFGLMFLMKTDRYSSA